MKTLVNILFYVTMPIRAVALGAALAIILLASTLGGGIWDYCDLNGAVEWVVG
jgi:hypothetical protein